MKWKTKDGIEMDIKHMDPIHAQNAIALIIKNSSPNTVLSAILYGVEQAKKKVNNKAFTVNGDMAQQDAMDFECWDITGIDPKDLDHWNKYGC